MKINDAVGQDLLMSTVSQLSHFPDETEPDALCTIFETLNRTGVKLSVFELLTARFWPLKINSRELLVQSQGAISSSRRFEVDPYYVLQAISLASRKAPSCKRSDVLNLAATDIEAWWKTSYRWPCNWSRYSLRRLQSRSSKMAPISDDACALGGRACQARSA